MRSPLFLLVCTLSLGSAVGQESAAGAVEAKTQAQAPIPTRTLTFHAEKSWPETADFFMYAIPDRCSPNGDVYRRGSVLKADGMLSGPFPEIHRITHTGDRQTLTFAQPSGFPHVGYMDFYSGAHQLAHLIFAESAEKDPETGRAAVTYFVSVSDLDGSRQHLYPIDMKFQAMKIAVLDSGDLVVLAIDKANNVPVLALLHSDGTFWKRLDIDHRDYQQSNELQAAFGPPMAPPPGAKSPSGQPPRPAMTPAQRAANQLQRALQSAYFVPFEAKVLLVQPGSSLPLRLIGEEGIQESIPIHLPAGYVIESPLTTDDSERLVLRLRTEEDSNTFAHHGMLQNSKDRLFLFNRRTGKPIESWTLDGANPHQVLCATDHRLTALKFVPVNGEPEPPQPAPGEKAKTVQREYVLGYIPYSN